VRRREAETESVAPDAASFSRASTAAPGVSLVIASTKFVLAGYRPLLVALLLLLGSWLPIAFETQVGAVFRQTSSILLGVLIRAVPLGLLTAAALVLGRPFARRWLVSLIVAWGAMPIGLTTIAWKGVWQRPESVVDRVCAVLGGFFVATPNAGRAPTLDASAALMRGENAVIWIHTAAALPWIVAIFSLALLTRPRGLDDAARLDPDAPSDAGMRRGAFAIVAAAIVAWGTIGDFAAADVFAVRTYAEEVYLGFPLDIGASGNGASGNGAPVPAAEALDDYRFPLSSHLAATLGAVGALAVSLGWSIGPLGRSEWEPRTSEPRMSLRVASTLLVAGLLLLMLVLPVIFLIGQAGTAVERVASAEGDGTSIERVWSIGTLGANLIEVLRRLLPEGVTTLSIAAGAVALAWLAAQAAIQAARRPIGAIVAVLIGSAAIGVPSPVAAVAALEARGAWGGLLVPLFDRSLAVPIVLLAIRLLPPALLVSALLSARIPQSLRDASRTEPWSPLGRWWRLEVAGQRRGQLGLVLLLSLIAASDIAATSLVLPPGTDTLARRLLGMVHAGVDDQVAAAALSAIVLAGAFAMLLTRPFARSLRARRAEAD